MTGQVAFNNMPADERVPLFYAEVNAGVPSYSGVSRTLLMGRKLSTGSAAIGRAVILGGSDPNALFGPGSMLADMAAFARWHNPNGAIWVFPVADPVSGAAATNTITITGPATSAGAIVRYIGGERYQASVAAGDSATAIATAFAAAVNAGYSKFNRRMQSCVTASAAAGVVTLTARHTGTEGNMIRVEAGLDGDEMDPAGLSVAIASVYMTGGTGTVDFPGALAALGNDPYDWVGAPYNSTANLSTSRTFFADSGSGRWSPTIGLNGHYITANDGNSAAQATLGAAVNDRHLSILGTNGYPAPLWCWIAAVVGWIGFSKNLGAPITEAVEIARPMQTLQLQGLRPPSASSSKWGQPDLQTLYQNGISALTFGPDGTPAINRILTTYQFNAWGSADNTFLGIETIAISAYVKSYLKYVVTSTYPRSALRDDNPSGKQGIVTPAQLKACIIHAYTDLDETAGVVENSDLFAQYLIVERSSDPNRVNAYLPIDVANQFIVFAANITIFPQLNDQIAALQ